MIANHEEAHNLARHYLVEGAAPKLVNLATAYMEMAERAVNSEDSVTVNWSMMEYRLRRLIKEELGGNPDDVPNPLLNTAKEGDDEESTPTP